MPTITGPRASAQINAYLSGKDPQLRAVANALRALVRKAIPSVTESVNPWGIPTFDANGPVCLFTVGKNHVTFGFARGTSLDNSSGLLEGTGKNLRHVKLYAPADLAHPALRGLVIAAAKLNRREPLTSSMRRAKPASRPARASNSKPKRSRRR
jgi:hypothetical protein